MTESTGTKKRLPNSFGNGFAVVAIDISPDKVTALNNLFADISSKWPVCYVVIPPRSLEHQPQISEMLKTHTPLPIEEIPESFKGQKGHIYLIPPGNFPLVSPIAQLQPIDQPANPEVNPKPALSISRENGENGPPIPEASDLENAQRIAALEEELRFTREHLQATIHQLEFSNENLKVINEELASTNEELQRTNEELQSLYEELHTVNAEHRFKIRELAATNADMDNLMASTRIGTIFLDRQLCIRKFTPAISAQFNIREGDIGRPISHFTHNLGEYSYHTLHQDLQEVIANGSTKQTNVQSSDKEWYIQRITPFINDKSTIDGAVISFVNITDLKNVEGELDKSNEKFHSLVEGTNAFVSIIDLQGKVLYSNNVLDTYKLDEFIGSNLFDWLDPALAIRVKQIVAEVVTSKRSATYSNSHIDPAGDTYYFLNVASPIFEGEKVSSIAIISNDVTNMKTLENELTEQNQILADRNRELEQFVYIASHDLQEPLNTVVNMTNLLSKKYEIQLDERGQKSLNFMQQAAGRMRTLIYSLMQYAQIGQPQIKDNIDTRQILNNILEDLAPLIKLRKAEIKISPLPKISGKMSDLRILFYNLVENALKFQNSDVKPLINIKAFSHDAHWEFRITDNGIGIHPEYQEQIFAIFQKLHKPEEYAGTGIGLSYCKKIVEQHGGKIWVTSRPNKGSTFHFTLPH